MEQKVYTVTIPGEDLNFSRTSGTKEFAKGEVTGTAFRKQIIKFGEYADQYFEDMFMILDEEWGNQVLENFTAGFPGRVPVPAGHNSWDPEANRGEVVDMMLSADGSGIDAVLDIRKPETVDDIIEDRIWDVSISFTMHYHDNKGVDHGGAVMHVALVNNPYVEGMTPFETFSKALKDTREAIARGFSIPQTSAIMLSRNGIRRELSMFKKITNDKDYPVEVTYKDAEGTEHKVTVEPGKGFEVPETVAEDVTKQIADAEKPADADDEEEETETPEEKAAREKREAEDADDTSKDGELSREKKRNAELSRKLAEANAEKTYSTLLGEGKITPAAKDAFMKLYSASQQTVEFSAKGGKKETVSVGDLIEKMFAAMPKVVDFNERGANNNDDNNAESGDIVKFSSLEQETQERLKASGIDEQRYSAAAKILPELFTKKENNKE